MKLLIWSKLQYVLFSNPFTIGFTNIDYLQKKGRLQKQQKQVQTQFISSSSLLWIAQISTRFIYSAEFDYTKRDDYTMPPNSLLEYFSRRIRW